MFTSRYTRPWFTGSAPTLPSVPSTWQAALNGRGYMLDDREVDAHLERSLPTIKQQFATTDEPGERSLNPEGAWRRAASSWHHGAGQSHREGESADSFRFSRSKGVYVWRRGELSLLDATSRSHSAAGSSVAVVAASGWLYYSDGQKVYRTDLTSRTEVTGTPAAACTSLAAAGSVVYACFGSSNIYKISGTTATSHVASAMSVVGHAKQRVLGANGKTLYDLSAGAATVVYDHVDANFQWVAFADGTSHIYAAGNSGMLGVIYRIGVVDDATALGKPVVAGRLPVGETVTALFGYAGQLFIGTSRGVRNATQAATGDLDVGPLIDIGQPVYGFAAWGQYVWFGWSSFDAISTGVGRIDPTVRHPDGSFAYASDLMAETTGTVRSVAVLNGTVAFGVDSSGLWAQTGTPVASGWLESGVITYDVTEPKLVVGGSLSVAGGGSASYLVAVDDGGFVDLYEAGVNRTGSRFDTRISLVSSAGQTPRVTSAVMRAIMQPRPSRVLLAPLLLHDQVVNVNGAESSFNVSAAIADIRRLWSTRTPTTYQEGGETFPVVVEDFEYRKINTRDDNQIWNGTVIVKMKVLA